MPITIDKILSDRAYDDGRQAIFILTDGAEKRKCSRSGLTDDDATMRTEILSSADELWAIHEKDKLDEGSGNIVTSKKTVNDKIPDKAAVRGMNSVPELRSAVADLIEAVEALKEQIS